MLTPPQAPILSPIKGQYPQGHVVSLAAVRAREATRIGRLVPVSHLVVATVSTLVAASAPREPAAGEALLLVFANAIAS